MPSKMYDCLTRTGRKQLTEEDIYNVALPVIRGILNKRYPKFKREHEDITQEVMMEIYQAMSSYKPIGCVEAFIFSVSAKTVSKIVKKKLLRRYEYELLAFDPEAITATPSPQEEVAQEGFETLLSSFEKKLTKQERRALEMRLEGATNTQIYNALHPRAQKRYIGQAMVQFWRKIAEKYVKWRISRE